MAEQGYITGTEYREGADHAGLGLDPGHKYQIDPTTPSSSTWSSRN